MRILLLLSLLLFQHVLVAQESVPELGRNSDKGQQVFDTRIGGQRSSATGKRIHDEKEVEQAPVFPGGMEVFLNTLWAACDSSMLKAWEVCNDRTVPSVRFVVDVDGRPTHAELISERPCPELEAGLYCAMRLLPHFEPGRLNGSAVRTRMELPLFELDR